MTAAVHSCNRGTTVESRRLSDRRPDRAPNQRFRRMLIAVPNAPVSIPIRSLPRDLAKQYRVQPPEREIQGCRETDPDEIRQEENTGHLVQ